MPTPDAAKHRATQGPLGRQATWWYHGLLAAGAYGALVVAVAAASAAPPPSIEAPPAESPQNNPSEPATPGPLPEETVVADPTFFFRTRIEPLFRAHCYQCHSADAATPGGGLRLDDPRRLVQGGASGPIVVAGQPAESLIVSAVRYESFEMPPQGQLPAEAIADLEDWVAHGAIDPRTASESPSPDGAGGTAEETPLGPPHWAFVPPRESPLPQNEADPWSRTGIDRFIQADLAAAGLSPSPPADPRSLARRLAFDLTGLLPTAATIEHLTSDRDGTRYDRIVAELLASPHFGERWGRHWLDVARYADTKGYVFQEDRNYPTAYLYRDWVISALNADMPYDEFVVRQIAGDLLPDTPEQRQAHGAGSGFLTLGRRFLNNPHDIADDRIDLLSRGLMGLTVSCARCHDHKYDPIPTADYYSLYGVLASSREVTSDEAPPQLVEGDLVEPVVFLRGNPAARGDPTPRRFLSCVSPETAEPFSQGSGRLELARAIASPANPLTARVWVNRVWAHLMGRGLVATQSDFGTRGTPPSHPELLDWLTLRFIEHDWSTKWLIESIVRSSVYRQSSHARLDVREVDPENILLARMNRRRLDLESMRDMLQQAAGQLDLTMGGSAVDLLAAPFSARRAVYGHIERQNLPAFFRTFDFANPNLHAPQRPQTASPHQALFLLNSPLIRALAHALAAQTAEHTGNDRIADLFQLALVRLPSAEELALAAAFVNDGGAGRNSGPDPETAEPRWVELAQTLLICNEFMFID